MADAYTSQPTATETLGTLGGGDGLSAILISLNTNINSFVIGENVQAYSANLDDLASKTPIDGDIVGTTDTQVLTNKTLTSPVIQGDVSGWTSESETLTYASAVTFTVAGDVTTRYRKGTKLWLTQITSKYFYVISSSYSNPNTTVTITGGSDYTLANAAITSPKYSYQENPQGFPFEFTAVSPVFDTATIDSGTGGVQPGVLSTKFRIFSGNKLNIQVKMASSNVLKNGAGKLIAFTVPSTLPNIANNTLQSIGSCYFGSIDTTGGAVTKNTTQIYFFADSNFADNQVLSSSTIDATYTF